MRNKERIVITGIGTLTASGSGPDEVWRAVENKKTGLVKKEYEMDGESLGKFYVHEIQDFDINRYDIDKSVLSEIENWKIGDKITDFYYFLAVIKMALKDGEFSINEKNNRSTGIILAHENMGFDHFYRKVIDELSYTNGENGRPKNRKEFLEAFYAKFHRTGYELQSFMALHHIAKVFDIHGYSLFINNACASGLFALEAASDAIKSGKCDKMIVASVDHCSIFKQMWFRNVNMRAKDGRIKPFASDRDGFTIGEGGAALIMERLEDALKRKARIYAEYAGGAFVLEGWKVTYPDISNDLYKKMIVDAISVSAVKPSDIDLIVPHGVGTSITDKYEAKAITDVFGKDKKKPIVTALKPYIGHTLGSTALLETALLLIGLNKDKVPPTLNCENEDKALGLNILKELISADGMKAVIKTACGFAGFNGACVFSVL